MSDTVTLPEPVSQESLAAAPQAPNPFDKTILLNVTVRMLGVTRNVSTDSVQVDADKDLLRVSKRIIDCEEFTAIQGAVTNLKHYLRNRSVPGVQFIKSGIYPIPLAKVEEIDARVNEFVAQYNGRVVKFLEVYEARANESRDRLKVLGNNADYPPVEKVRQAFGIATEYVTMGPPSSLGSVSKEIYIRETKRIREICTNATEQARDAMRLIVQELVTHSIERLTPGPEGKPKVFKKSMISNMKEFIDGFGDRNITDDAELSTLVEQMRGIMAGKTADSLRTDATMRQDVAEQMLKVKSALDTMVQDKPSRAAIVE